MLAGKYGARRRLSAGIARRGIVEIHLRRRGLISERNVVLAHVVLFVAADPFIEDPGAGAQNGLLFSGQIIRKPDARGESVPVVINQTLREFRSVRLSLLRSCRTSRSTEEYWKPW